MITHQRDVDLGNLVTPRSTIMGRDFANWNTNHSQSFTVILKIKGKCDIQTLQQHILRTWVHKRNRETNDLWEYPELQQYCVLRLGYLFSKWGRKFGNLTSQTM
ncbi:unnamed protein product [Orchesella dallaii]|uniref:Uncharacterized protein n=1 Tax=Orchesella dallaii TaxID=48710 RepID=A0ABP1QIF2_9HEXA